MKKILDKMYGDTSEQVLDILLPDAEVFPVFIYFHGGGLESGDKRCVSLFAEELTRNGVCVVSANYRMYPTAKYPEFIEDAASAVAWVFKHINEYGKAVKIFIGGSSAGGYLSQMLCFDKRWLGAHGITNEDIAGYVHDAGQPTCHFNVLRERGINKRRVIVDEAAPLYHVGEDENYPPMLILVSDNDIKGRLEQTNLLAATLNHFGHTDNVRLTVTSGKHCWYVKKADEDGVSVFAKLVLPFILGE